MSELTVPSEYSVQCEVITSANLHRYWWKVVQSIVRERPETARAYSPQELYNYYIEQLHGMGDFYEVRLMFGGYPVGMAIIIPEQDPHVGVTMSCMVAYAEPAHRKQAWLIQSLTQIAKASGVQTISWTHRMSGNKYCIYHRRVR